MEAFETPKHEHDDEAVAAWPPGMPEGDEPSVESEPVEQPEPEATEPEPVFEPEAEPVAEELSEGEVFEPHAVHLESEPVPAPEPEPLSEDEAEALVEEPVLAESRPSRTPRIPRVRRPNLGGATITIGDGSPRVLALVALLAVVGAVGLLVMRNSNTTEDSSSAPPAATSKPKETPSTPTATKPAAKAPAAGFTRVNVTAGGYSVDVPSALTRAVNGPLVTFSSADRSRAYAVNGKRSDESNLRTVAKRVLGGYRDDYRLSDVRVSRAAGGDMRVSAHGTRRSGGARQDLLALVFRDSSGKGTYVLQRFTPRGKTAPAAELDSVRASVKPLS